MSSATLPRQRRRALVLGTLIVLAHWMVFAWFGAHVGAPRVLVHETEARVAQARLALQRQERTPVPEPLPLPLAELPPPPLPEPPALPDLAPLPELAPAAAQPASAYDPAGVAPQVPAESAAPGEGPADPVATPAGAPATGAKQAGGQASEPPAAAAPELRAYKVNMPPPADITLNVARTDADGTEWSGEAQLSWRLDERGYRIRIEAGIRVVFARVNLAVLTSEGAVTDSGFTPLKMTEKRRGRSMTATHFDREQERITFSATQQSYPLAPGTQDKASVPLQLSAIARADPNQFAEGIEMLVGEDRDASVFRFVVVGQEEIETRLGKLQTLRLSRPPREGSYRSRLDIWLAPGHGWLPVQIRNTEASGAVTTQTVNDIVMVNTGH
jgi:hypothetical protein